MTLVKLAIDRIAELGEVAFKVHGDLERWRDPPWKDTERTEMGVRFNKALEEQRKWTEAILDFVDTYEDWQSNR